MYPFGCGRLTCHTTRRRPAAVPSPFYHVSYRSAVTTNDAADSSMDEIDIDDGDEVSLEAKVVMSKMKMRNNLEDVLKDLKTAEIRCRFSTSEDTVSALGQSQHCGCRYMNETLCYTEVL